MLSKTVSSYDGERQRLYESGATVYTDATDTAPAMLVLKLRPGRYDHLKTEGQVMASQLGIAFMLLAMKKYPNFADDDKRSGLIRSACHEIIFQDMWT